MCYTKQSWHRELQCCICPYSYPPHARSLTFRLYLTPMEAWTFKHQTRADVVAFPSDVDTWFRKTPSERHQPAVVQQCQHCRQVCSMPIYVWASKLTGHCNRLVFHWLAIPWLQKAADSYVYDHNTSRRRASRHKVLPNEILDVMFENLEIVNALDFKVHQHTN
jgi:hypothetical protein